MAVTIQLFRDYDLGRVLTSQGEELSKEVGSLSEDQVLSASPEDLCSYFVGKFSVDVLEIDETAIQTTYDDAQLDVSRRIEYLVLDESKPFYVNGSKFTFYVPFSGDAKLLKCRPSTLNLAPLQANVKTNELELIYYRTQHDPDEVRNAFKRDLKNLKENLTWIARDVERFNSTVRERAGQLISARREKLLQDKGLVEQLGFPLRRRDGMPETYVTPKVKRRIVPQLPKPSTESYRPEPALGMDDYDYILSFLSNMASVMERSPRTFKGMGEEDFRTQFLIPLNGIFAGQATGETFNYEGKTDILIRVDGRNIFIAECKFWHGPSRLMDALNQLRGYTSWRDTKTALLIFNRGTKMSTVLERVQEVVKEHPGYKTERVYDSETGFRYIFGHRDDPNREIHLTVLVFDVPG